MNKRPVEERNGDLRRRRRLCRRHLFGRLAGRRLRGRRLGRRRRRLFLSAALRLSCRKQTARLLATRSGKRDLVLGARALELLCDFKKKGFRVNP